MSYSKIRMVKIIFEELFWNKSLIIQILTGWYTVEYSTNSHFLSRMQVQNMSHHYYLGHYKDRRKGQDCHNSFPRTMVNPSIEYRLPN